MFEKFTLNKQKLWNFWFSGFPSSLLKYKKNFFNLATTIFHFPKYKKFFQGWYFYFLSSEVPLWSFLVLGLESSVSQKIRKFRFLKYKKIFFFFLRKYKKYFSERIFKEKFWGLRSENIEGYKVRATKFHFTKYKTFFRGKLFYFFDLGLKVHQVTLYITTKKLHKIP